MRLQPVKRTLDRKLWYVIVDRGSQIGSGSKAGFIIKQVSASDAAPNFPSLGVVRRGSLVLFLGAAYINFLTLLTCSLYCTFVGVEKLSYGLYKARSSLC